MPNNQFKKMIINNPFLGQFKLLLSCKKIARGTNPGVAFKKLSKELNIPYQMARGILVLSERSLRRLCNNI